MSKLILGIPKGSLQEATIELFKRSGWDITMSSRSYFPQINDPEISVSICRAQEMSRYVENGTFDAGLTGRDWIMENNSSVEVVCDLLYSKSSQRPVRWVLAVPAESEIRDISQLKGAKIATELTNFTRRYFAEQGIDVKVEFSWGATEAKVISGLCDAVVEATETGSTLRANGLRIVKELLVSNTQLISNASALADPFKREKIDQIALLLKGALKAKNMVGIKMNVPEASLKEVLGILPAITSPTTCNLANPEWWSVEVVVDKGLVRDMVPKLLKEGAEGIVEYPLNKVI